jgi:long-chain acyl-CoA synthetase/crotonobetaine/carnitine-CoA ligase
MTSTISTRTDLEERVADALRVLEAQEANCAPTTIGELVSAGAKQYGTRVAIDFFERNERATFEELDRDSNRYAHALRAFGVAKGDRVGVMLPNRVEFPIVWFALAKLGAVIVPINMRYTSREVEYVLTDTQAKFAFIDESAWPAFSAMEPWPKDLAMSRVVVVGTSPHPQAAALADLLKGASAAPVDALVTPDDLLTIQYTSGTTGFPKGCMLTHDYWNLTGYASSCRDFAHYERFMCWSPFYYIDGSHLLLKAWREGGTLYLPNQLSSSRFLDWLKTYRIDWVQLPELVVRQPPSPDDAAVCLKQVHQFGSWSAGTMRIFNGRFGARSSGYYGMTEIGAGTQYPIQIDEMAEAGSLGMRAPFRELKLLNEDGSPTPVGEIGEMWVKGRGILLGYWNRPEVNSEHFKDGWFRTGDLMRRDELGFYWLVGRTKDMIRRSGENIAAREVESVIREVAGIGDVAAVPVRDARRGEEVKIVVEPLEGLQPSDIDVDRILEHARARLAPFKVPRYIGFIPKLPRTATSNKITKRELVDAADPLAGVYDAEEKRWR